MTCKWLNLCNIYLTLYWLFFFLPTGELYCSNCKWSIQESWSLWSSSVKQHACIWSDCFPAYTMYISQSLREYKVHSFSSPEANLLLISTKNCPLGNPIFQACTENLCQTWLVPAQSDRSLWIVDFWCWTFSEVTILAADQKERSLRGRRRNNNSKTGPYLQLLFWLNATKAPAGSFEAEHLKRYKTALIFNPQNVWWAPQSFYMGVPPSTLLATV